MSRVALGIVTMLALIGSEAWPSAAQTRPAVNEDVVHDVAAQLR